MQIKYSAVKLFVTLLAAASFVYADSNDCSQGAQQVVDKLAAHNRTSVTLSYSADNATKADTCKAAILAKNPAITVNLKPIAGTNQFKFSK